MPACNATVTFGGCLWGSELIVYGAPTAADAYGPRTKWWSIITAMTKPIPTCEMRGSSERASKTELHQGRWEYWPVNRV